MPPNGVSELVLLPVGRVDEELPIRLRAALEQVVQVRCRIGEYVPRPLDAFDHERTQYAATKVLERLEQLHPGDETALLALMDGDLYVEPYNFTFGHSGLKHRVGVVSVTRLRPEFWGEESSSERLFGRAVVQALYHVGRVLGLSSCDEPTCAMSAVNGIGDVDRKRRQFCTQCEQMLGLEAK